MPARSDERTQQLVDTIITAIEGGTGYWAYALDYEWGSDNGEYKMGPNEYASVTLQDMDSGERYAITIETIAIGWQRILNGECHVGSHIMRYMLEDDVDADAADCIVQAAIFGEIVYS